MIHALGESTTIATWLAQRSGFEPSRPFISRTTMRRDGNRWTRGKISVCVSPKIHVGSAPILECSSQAAGHLGNIRLTSFDSGGCQDPRFLDSDRHERG